MLQALLISSFMLPVHMPGGGRNNGSSVLIAPRLALTAAHVIKDAVMSVDCQGVQIPAVVIRQDDAIDLALLYLTQTCDAPTAKLTRHNAPIGTAVTAIGCPDGNCGWQAKGHVVGYTALGIRDLPRRPVLVTDAPIYFGNSGGPLVDDQGRLVGICSQVFRFSAGGDQSIEQWAPRFGAFVPAEAIFNFLDHEDEPALQSVGPQQ